MWTLAQAAPATPPFSWAELLGNLTSNGTIAIILIFLIPIVGIVMGTLSSILSTRSKERTRQEIAAYVAEGTMSAEEGERLLKAGAGSGK